MTEYNKSIRFLYGLEVFGMKFGLRGIRSLLDSIGNPHRDFASIHVAGTNGKGSTSSMLAAVFTAAGYTTGLYTSPHLVSFTERIRIDGKPIPPREVIRLTNLIREQVRKQRATYFEAVTAMAFRYFADSHVDIAIIETGLGGRLDATNVLRPLVSVITNVSLEHTEILGNTLEEIAREKAGIIKPSTPCVTGILQRGPLAVLRRRAQEINAPLNTTRPVSLKVIKSTLDGLVVNIRTRRMPPRRLRVSLAGNHQAMNVRLVLRTLDIVQSKGWFSIAERHIRKGMRNVGRLSGLDARLSVLSRHPLVIADVAHNADSVQRLVDSLRELGVRNVLLVFGVVQDKDYRRMIESLKPITRKAIVTKAQTKRARAVEELVHEFRRQGIPVAAAYSTVRKAVASALAMAGTRDRMLIAGSHYVVGEAIAHLRKRKFT